MKNKLLNIHPINRCVTLFALTLISLFANSQIVYTDIVPDFTSENVGDFYNMDLNNDGTVDFSLKSINSSELIGMEANANGVNAMAATGGPFDPYIIPLEENAVIANPSDYYDTNGFLPLGICNNIPSFCTYDWGGMMDKYLGLRVLINGQTHYGWARMDVATNTQWTIKDYAYQATPNTPILAGQMVLGVEEIDFAMVKVSVANQTISIFNLPNRTEYNLYAINGQKILHGILQPTVD
ncbi:MAG: hypothetical protein ABIO60_06830, partial [Aquaticitalea sp.]